MLRKEGLREESSLPLTRIALERVENQKNTVSSPAECQPNEAGHGNKYGHDLKELKQATAYFFVGYD